MHSTKSDDIVVECSAAKVVVASDHGSSGEFVCKGDEIIIARLPLNQWGDESYIRITVIDCHGNRAWPNPIWRD